MSKERQEYPDREQESWTENTATFIEVRGPADTTRRPVRPEILRKIRRTETMPRETPKTDENGQSRGQDGA